MGTFRARGPTCAHRRRDTSAAPSSAPPRAGRPGADLLSAARCFAAALVTPDADARTWELVSRGAHPDVVEFEPESTVISVAQARSEIVPEAWASPVEPRSARKVVVVLEAERLQLEAENALLKTFEEPPESTVILLVTSVADDLLDTTRSRCQRIDLATLSEATVATVLVSEGHDADLAANAARLSGGQLGRARALLGERRELRAAFVDAARGLDGTGAAVAQVADGLGVAVKDAIAATKTRHEEELAEFEAVTASAGYLPRRSRGQRKRMATRHSRHERMARREALVEGITALETMYRDSLAGTDAPRATSTATT